MTINNFFNDKEIPLEKLLEGGGFCGIFRKIGCIGDSLSSGEFEYVFDNNERTYADMFEYSWGQHVARTVGCTVYNFSRGGMTAEEYFKTFAEENNFWDKEKACSAYILALGVNDFFGQKKPLGTKKDVCDDLNDPTDTFIGYYTAIIKKIQKEIQPNAKFFLMTMLRKTPYCADSNCASSDNENYDAIVDSHADALYMIAKAIPNCYVIDFRKYGPADDDYFKQKFYMNGHLTPAGYILIGQMTISYVDYIIRHNIKDFDMVGFIGKEHLLEKPGFYGNDKTRG